MTTDVTILVAPRRPVSDWEAVCDACGLAYAPNKAGQSTWVLPSPDGLLPRVEASLDRAGTVRQGRGGAFLWDTAAPPPDFGAVTLSIPHGAPTAGLGALAREAAARLGATASASPEADHEIALVPRSYEAGDHYEADVYLPTDGEGGWEAFPGGLRSDVPAGNAVLSHDGGLVALAVDGARVATFADARAAMAFAGRFAWTWWRGDARVPPASPALTGPPR